MPVEGLKVETAPDTLEDAVILEDLVDSIASKIEEGSFRRIRDKHRIPFENVSVPSRH